MTAVFLSELGCDFEKHQLRLRSEGRKCTETMPKTMPIAREVEPGQCPHGSWQCSDCGGKRRRLAPRKLCIHLRERYYCFDCGGAGTCHHEKRLKNCQPCGGKNICIHLHIKRACVKCDPKKVAAQKARIARQLLEARATQMDFKTAGFFGTVKALAAHFAVPAMCMLCTFMN